MRWQFGLALCDKLFHFYFDYALYYLMLFPLMFPLHLNAFAFQQSPYLFTP